MKGNRLDKSFNSRLKRWVERLLQLNFEFGHLPGTCMGLVECVWRKPHHMAPNITQSGEQFIVAALDLMKSAAKRFLLNKSNFEQNAPQLQASCQFPKPIDLITPQIASRKEDSIHAKAIYCAKKILRIPRIKRAIQAKY